MADQEKLAMEALEEVGGGVNILNKIKKMSPTKKVALGTGILAALGIGTHEAATGGAWTKAAWNKASSIFNEATEESVEPSDEHKSDSTETGATPAGPDSTATPVIPQAPGNVGTPPIKTPTGEVGLLQ